MSKAIFNRETHDNVKQLLRVPPAFPSDEKLLNFLQAISNPRFGWVCRPSTSGRGWRLHETTRDDASATVREAIAAAMELTKGE